MLQAAGPHPSRRLLRWHAGLITIPQTAIPMGPYVVSPATHPTDCGRFSASFAVQRGAGDDRPRRVFRLSTTFASHAAARLVAVTQGWLHTSMARPPAV